MACEAIDGFGDSAEYLQQMLPGIPLATLKQFYSMAMIEFCQRSGVWRYVFERLQVFCDEQTYQLDKELEQDIVKIDSIYVADGCGTGCNDSESKIPERQGVQRSGASCCSDQSWYEPQPGMLIFNECFTNDGCLRLELVLKPEHGSTNMPPDLLSKYKTTIEEGVLSKAYMVPNQSWSNQELAVYNRALFDRAIKDAERVRRLDVLPGRAAYKPQRYSRSRSI